MKVEISNYPTHRWYHNFLYNTFVIKNEQKVSVQIDPWDTWSMDHTLAHIVVPMLKQLKEASISAGVVDNSDVPKELQSDAIEGGVSVTHFKKWNWVMDEMIFAFESKLVDWEDQFYSGEHDFQWIQRDNGMSEMVLGPNDTYKVDWKGRAAYQKRITRGFKLFGKYFENLWD